MVTYLAVDMLKYQEKIENLAEGFSNYVLGIQAPLLPGTTGFVPTCREGLGILHFCRNIYPARAFKHFVLSSLPFLMLSTPSDRFLSDRKRLNIPVW